MEIETQNKLEGMDAKLNAIYTSVEKTRKYFLTIMWITIAMVVLPIVGLLFVIPSFISTYTSTLEGLL
ncbi:hypothetical protein COB87_002265 [Candidatus Wolfebacteria bacterium]|nr:hypothetical protein [Candidatus Wolfebacteria bacterium]